MADHGSETRPPERTADAPGHGPHPASAEHAVPRSPAWPWLTVLAVAVVAAGLLAWHPWTPSEPDAAPAPGTTTPAPSPSSTPSTPPVESPEPSAPADPATRFDDDTVDALFLTDAELAEAVPGAAGLSLAPADEAIWGLPDGSSVTPASCTTVVTVVAEEPRGFTRLFAFGETVTVVQSIDLLADAGAAREAFDALVDVLGECDAYQQVNPEVDGGAWTAEPPTTTPGDLPTVVRRMVHDAEGGSSPEVEVTALVANALVTTTVSAVDPAGDPADPATFAAVARAAGERALAQVGSGG